MKSLFTGLFLAGVLSATADEVKVTKLRITEPITQHAIFLTDSTDVFGKQWDDNSALMETVTNLSAWKQGTLSIDSILPAPTENAVRLAGFTIQNRNFANASISVRGAKECAVYIDGEKTSNKGLMPGRHEVVLKIRQKANTADTLKVSINSEQELELNPTSKAPYSLDVLMHGERMGGVSISADGRFIALDKYETKTDSKTEWKKYLIDTQTGNRSEVVGFRQWTSKGHEYIVNRKNTDLSLTYERVDALTGRHTAFFTDYSNERGSFLPGEEIMMIHKHTEGPKEDREVFQVLEPDDRQPGWRDRSNISLLYTRTGVIRQITKGQHNVGADMNPDGKQMLLYISENDITTRPFSFTTAVILDLQTMKADTLFHKDGFVNHGRWSPDGKSIVFQGSPEAFNGIGKRVPEGMTPSMTEQDLFLYDIASKTITPLTADFDPNISDWEWSEADGMIYALCEDKDCQTLYRINPKTKKCDLIKTTECFVMRFDIADEKPILTYYGQGASNSDRLYVIDLKNGKERLIEDLDAVRMKDIELGEFGEWNFKAERGDTIYGRYYLPPHFDVNKKYPMLVYYYGGCSPTGRYLDSYYSYHGWAAMGYVVYVIQPSGCTGFGQEFSARHVNAYGDYTADDIIQGTKQFCQEHPFVNEKKIGCLGASYGGFMTQYLQTQTDIFAAAMSHAGISDPTSYWGYGYWGYSYSTISAANSYPWNNKELFTDHAPLTLADRIHTPILFMHGNADTNVPINESIQMFTALKILGRECAFVTVDGQNHHILDYYKRIKWQNTIYAWFQKWLKDDASWWEEMYPTKNIK